MGDPSPTVGAQLQRARLQSGLTTTQVSDITRVRRAIVEAIERDDHALAGGAVYARGHIRAMAAVVGLDPAPLLAQLDTEASPHAVIVQPVVSPVMSAAVPPESVPAAPSLGVRLAGVGAALRQPDRRGPNWSAVMAGALVLVVVVAGVQLVRSAASSAPRVPVAGATPTDSPSPVVTAPSTSTTVPSPTPTASGGTPSPTGDVVAQADAVNVVITATSRSWVSVITTKRGTVFEGLLRKGETRTFTDKKKVKLTFGNAGGVNLTVNGQDVGAPGGLGKVVSVSFGPGDPTQSQA